MTSANIFACRGASFQILDAAGLPVGDPMVTESVSMMEEGVTSEEKENIGGRGQRYAGAKTDDKVDFTVTFKRYDLEIIAAICGWDLVTSVGKKSVGRSGSARGPRVAVRGISDSADTGEGFEKFYPVAQVKTVPAVSLMDQEFTDFTIGFRAFDDETGKAVYDEEYDIARELTDLEA